MSEVIVALDVPTADAAFALVDTLDGEGDFFKVGLELFTREGPSVVTKLVARGHRVFLDLKLHDIPNTVAQAVASATELGVDLLTVHSAGGTDMLRAASDATDERMRVVGVTVLTSLSPSAVEEIWGRELISLRDEVVRLASMCHEAGLDGVVASAQEASSIKQLVGRSFDVVTPGIRLPGGSAHDQARVATPAEAAQAGSDYLVVGRAVTQADDPRAVLRQIKDAACVGATRP